MTKDLAMLVPGGAEWLTTEDFLDTLDANLRVAMT
jgi:isocitrate dehydrogenase